MQAAAAMLSLALRYICSHGALRRQDICRLQMTERPTGAWLNSDKEYLFLPNVWPQGMEYNLGHLSFGVNAMIDVIV